MCGSVIKLPATQIVTSWILPQQHVPPGWTYTGYMGGTKASLIHLEPTEKDI